VPLKFPKCITNSLNSQDDPQVQKSQTVEALNVKKSVNQLEKAVRAGFRHRNKAVFYLTPETSAGKNLMPDGMTHAPISGACVGGLRLKAVYCSNFHNEHTTAHNEILSMNLTL